MRVAKNMFGKQFVVATQLELSIQTAARVIEINMSAHIEPCIFHRAKVIDNVCGGVGRIRFQKSDEILSHNFLRCNLTALLSPTLSGESRRRTQSKRVQYHNLRGEIFTKRRVYFFYRASTALLYSIRRSAQRGSGVKV